MKHMTKTDNQNLNKLGYQTATSRLFNLIHSPDGFYKSKQTHPNSFTCL